MLKVLFGFFRERLNFLIFLQFFIDMFIPESIVIIVVVYWQISHPFLPYELSLGRFNIALLLLFHSRDTS